MHHMVILQFLVCLDLQVPTLNSVARLAQAADHQAAAATLQLWRCNWLHQATKPTLHPREEDKVHHSDPQALSMELKVVGQQHRLAEGPLSNSRHNRHRNSSNN